LHHAADPGHFPRVKDQNAVIVSLKLSEGFGTDVERDGVLKLGDTLRDAVESQDLGEFDGDEFGHGTATLYFYGPDADLLLSVIEPVLKGAQLLHATKVVKRYGEPGDREVRISWDRTGRRRERAVPPRRDRPMPPAEIGDAIEIATPNGFGYVQYTHFDEIYGELVRVLDGAFGERPAEDVIARLTAGPTVFHAFVFLQDAVKHGEATVVGNHPIPSHAQKFPVFRDGLPNPRTRKVDDWVLWDGKRQWPVGAISDEQRKIPLRRILPVNTLGDRIAKGWRPENSAE
jgi:hypothetical protein